MATTFSVAELAAYLNVSTDCIYTLVREKQIPHVRIRRRIIFVREIIDEWLREQSNVMKVRDI
jgi:excisionase family DNA binding protein